MLVKGNFSISHNYLLQSQGHKKFGLFEKGWSSLGYTNLETRTVSMGTNNTEPISRFKLATHCKCYNGGLVLGDKTLERERLNM